MKKNRTLVVLLLIAVTIFVFLFAKKATKSSTPTTSDATTSDSQQFIKGSPDTAKLKAGGNSYLDPKENYLFLYPNDYKIDSQNGGQYTRIYKIGATQKGQTEIYDGVVIVFESINLEGKSLTEFTTNRTQALTQDGTSKVLSEPKPILFGKYSGLVYELQGLGDSTHIIIQKNSGSNSAVEITFSVSDPQKQNYIQEVYEIFSTIELLK